MNAGAVTKAEMAARLTLAVHVALREHPDDFKAGAGWYPAQRAELARVAEAAGLPAETVAAAAATLSPAGAWSTLMERLPNFLRDVGSDNARPQFPTYGANREKAAAIVRAGAGVAACTGTKVSTFAKALWGDDTAVTVDRHAAELALGFRPRTLGRPLVSRIAAAYTAVAVDFGLTPRDLQAALWVAKVGMGGDAGGARLKAAEDSLDDGPDRCDPFALEAGR